LVRESEALSSLSESEIREDSERCALARSRKSPIFRDSDRESGVDRRETSTANGERSEP
jgi:hypothetical protein